MNRINEILKYLDEEIRIEERWHKENYPEPGELERLKVLKEIKEFIEGLPCAPMDIATLHFDGSKSIKEVVEAWNKQNPRNQLTMEEI